MMLRAFVVLLASVVTINDFAQWKEMLVKRYQKFPEDELMTTFMSTARSNDVRTF
jgi:hypothetical protein